MKYFIAFILTLSTICMQAQTYEGVIGKHQIFLELDIDYNGNGATAFYFYKSQLKNIFLEGNNDASKLILFEKFSDINEQKELFTLSVTNDKITGSWQNNGMTLAVDLTKTSKSFEDYKLSKLKYVKDSIISYENKELVWFTEKHSKQSFFRVGKGFKKSECEFMNAKLEEIHANYVMTQLDCIGMELKIELELLSNQYLSFNTYPYINCGGAHPSYNTEGYNFDFKNKKQLDKITGLYPNVNLFQALKKKYDNTNDLQSECEYFTQGEWIWENASWVMTKDGITFTPSYPHAMKPCEDGFPLTYKELEQHNKD